MAKTETYQTGVGISQVAGKINFTEISYAGIIVIWVIGVVLYVIFLRKELTRRRQEENAESLKRKRHRGKRCPQCRNVISAHRKVCQHCGYEFSEVEIKQSTETEGQTQHHHHSKSSGRRRKKKRGKKCPKCNNVINFYREVCQHCGYKFDAEQPNQGPDEPENPENSENEDVAN